MLLSCLTSSNIRFYFSCFIILCFYFSTPTIAATASAVDEHHFRTNLPSGLQIAGDIQGRYFIKGEAYFQMSLRSLDFVGYTHPETDQYFTYSSLREKFGHALPPREITGGQFQVTFQVYGLGCLGYWTINHKISVNVARKAALTDDTVGSLMGEYTSPKHANGERLSQEESKQTTACLRENNGMVIEIQHFKVSDVYAPIPDSLTRYGDRVLALFKDEEKQKKQEIAEREKESAQNRNEEVEEEQKVAGQSSAGEKTGDEAEQQKIANKDEDTVEKRRRGNDREISDAGQRAIMKRNLEYAAALEDAKAAEARGDDASALAAWERANAWSPNAKTREKVSHYRLKGHFKQAGNLLGRALVEMNAERRARRQQELEAQKQETSEQKEAHMEAWAKRKDQINILMRKAAYALTEDKRYVQPPKQKGWGVTSIQSIKPEDFVYGPDHIFKEQSQLPKDQRSKTLYVFGFQVDAKNYWSDIKYNARHHRLHVTGNPSAEAYRKQMAYPEVSIRTTGIAQLTLQDLIEAPIENLHSAVARALQPAYPMEVDSIRVVAATDRETIETIRKMLMDNLADGLTSKTIASNTGDISAKLRGSVVQVIDVEAAIKQLSSGNFSGEMTLETTKGYYVNFNKDKYIMITAMNIGSERYESSRLSARSVYAFTFGYAQKHNPPFVNFKAMGEYFVPDLQVQNSTKGWFWGDIYGLYPRTYQSPGYFATEKLKLDSLTKNGKYGNCMLGSFAERTAEVIQVGTYTTNSRGRIELQPEAAALIVPCVGFTPVKVANKRVRLRFKDKKWNKSQVDVYYPMYSKLSHYRSGGAYYEDDFNIRKGLDFRRKTVDGVYGWHARKLKKMTIYRKDDPHYFWMLRPLDKPVSGKRAPLPYKERTIRFHWSVQASEAYSRDRKYLLAKDIKKVLPKFRIKLKRKDQFVEFDSPFTRDPDPNSGEFSAFYNVTRTLEEMNYIADEIIEMGPY